MNDDGESRRRHKLPIEAGIGFPHFWNQLDRHDERPAIVEGKTGVSVSYRQLSNIVQEISQRFAGPRKRLAYIVIGNDLGGILCYLGLIASGNAVCLAGRGLVGETEGIIARYQPDIVLWKDDSPPPVIVSDMGREHSELFGYQVSSAISQGSDLEGSLALLLRTSGSTGSPHVVRLSYQNVAANAWQIACALELCSSDRVMLSLPLDHVYGLSVLHSALTVGASVVVGAGSIMAQDFWTICRSSRSTFLPVVPAQLQLMSQISPRLIVNQCPRHICVSGAAIDIGTKQWLLDEIRPMGFEVHSMYGMTEACGRMTVLSRQEFDTHPASVGFPVPYGRIELAAMGEIIYKGPNVMMGYAVDREYLADGDKCSGTLVTGDLGELDDDGRLYITGRLSRFCKILGLRVNLNDLEQQLRYVGDVAITSDDSAINIYYTTTDVRLLKDLAFRLARRMRVPRNVMVFTKIDSIPRTTSNKIRYRDLSNAPRMP